MPQLPQRRVDGHFAAKPARGQRASEVPVHGAENLHRLSPGHRPPATEGCLRLWHGTGPGDPGGRCEPVGTVTRERTWHSAGAGAVLPALLEERRGSSPHGERTGEPRAQPHPSEHLWLSTLPIWALVNRAAQGGQPMVV